MIEELVNTLRSIIAPIVSGGGFGLVEIKYHKSGQEHVICVLADKPNGGITIQECALLNTQIRNVLEQESFLEGNFTLEVCSPGLDRPLVEEKDFLRCVPCKIRVFLKEYLNAGSNGNKKKEFEGELVEVLPGAIKLNTSCGVLVIPISNIVKAKQIIYSATQN